MMTVLLDGMCGIGSSHRPDYFQPVPMVCKALSVAKQLSSLPRSQEAGDASGDIASAGKSISLFPERGSARRPRPLPTKANIT